MHSPSNQSRGNRSPALPGWEGQSEARMYSSGRPGGDVQEGVRKAKLRKRAQRAEQENAELRKRVAQLETSERWLYRFYERTARSHKKSEDDLQQIAQLDSVAFMNYLDEMHSRHSLETCSTSGVWYNK